MCFVNCSIASFDFFFFFKNRRPRGCYSSRVISRVWVGGLAGSRTWLFWCQASCVTTAPSKLPPKWESDIWKFPESSNWVFSECLFCRCFSTVVGAEASLHKGKAEEESSPSQCPGWFPAHSCLQAMDGAGGRESRMLTEPTFYILGGDL